MDPSVLLSAAALVGVAELGDKSMFAVISLATRYGRRSVFIGASVALILLSVIGALVGGAVSEFVDDSLLTPLAGLAFLVFGVHMLISKGDESNDEAPRGGKYGILASFSLLVLMEMGDKTQLTVFALAAGSGEVLSVIIGAAGVLTAMVAVEVLLGGRLAEHIEAARMKRLAGVVFLLFGSFYLLRWLL